MFAFIARKISGNTYINVMDQYAPGYRAGDIPSLDRPVEPEEVRRALLQAEKCGLRRLDKRRRWILRL